MSVPAKKFSGCKSAACSEIILRYGYVSEELLTEEELRTLLTLPDSREEETTCRVYTMSEWLREIYEGRKIHQKMSLIRIMKRQFASKCMRKTDKNRGR